MIPLYMNIDSGTDYWQRQVINPLALYLTKCGWVVNVFVCPPLEVTIKMLEAIKEVKDEV